MISEQLAGFLQFCAQGSDPLGHSDQETSGLLQVAEEAAPPPGAQQETCSQAQQSLSVQHSLLGLGLCDILGAWGPHQF